MNETLRFFDSHAHLTSKPLAPHVDILANRAWNAGVQRIINICTDQFTLEKGLELAKKYPWISNAGATTPHDVDKEGEQMFSVFAKAAREGAFAAVGETGLDYFYEHSDREVQKDFLKRYLTLAKECKLPIIIHCREAFADFFKILDSEYTVNGKHLPGVLHCFTGTVEEAMQVVERGWYLSLSGIVTFKKSEELRQVARRVPLEHLLIETDAPYLAPQSNRGKTNEPSFVPETAQLIADVKGLTLAAVAEASWNNASELFSPTATALTP